MGVPVVDTPHVIKVPIANATCTLLDTIYSLS